MTVERPAPLGGITPILVTPYDHHDRPAFEEVARQVDHLARLGVTAIGVGFGSDIVRMTDRERDDLVSVVAADRAPPEAGDGRGERQQHARHRGPGGRSPCARARTS